MPSIRKQTTKAGKVFYEIRVHPGRRRPELTTRWYPPATWGERTVERELARRAAEFEQKCRSGEVVSRKERKTQAAQQQDAGKALTVRQFGEQVFMPAKTVTCAENTRYSFKLTLQKHVYPTLGDAELRQVTSGQLNALMLDFQKTGAAYSTCLRFYGLLHLFFKTAYLQDFLTADPMEKVQRPKPRKEEARPSAKAYSVEELRYILECLEQEPLPRRALVRLLIDTGIRRGEAVGLTWDHVDFQQGLITICQTLNYTADRGVYLSTTKNGRLRVISVDPEVMALLTRLRQAQQPGSTFVFTRPGTTEPISPSSPSRYLQRFGKKYGIPELHPHKLRHTFASLALTNGADVVSVSQILGHSDTSVTLRVYAHADQESQKRASDLFRQAVKGPADS